MGPGMYFLIGSGTPGVYTRSGVYLDPALNGHIRYVVWNIACMFFIPILQQLKVSVYGILIAH